MKKNIEKIIEILKDSGLFLLLLLGCILLVSSLSLLCNIGITRFHLFLNVILSIILFSFIFRKKKISKVFISIIIALLVFVLAVVLNKNYIDLSWDGNTYHKDAVGLLKNGWNPIYENYIDAYERIGNRNMDYIGNRVEKTHGFWQSNYAMGTWLIGSNIYSVTNDIETGKAYNLLIIYITFVLMLFVLYKASSNFVLSLVASLITAFNPIILVQSFTYYNDGFMGSLLILLVSLMILFNDDKKIFDDSELYLSICSILMIIINVKFTGFAYAGIFCLFYYLIYVYDKYKNKSLKDIIKPTFIFALTVIVSVLIVGFNPYVKNLTTHHQLFYPLQGKNKVDIVSYNQPIKFANKSTFYKSGVSILSRVTNSSKNSPLPIVKKIPFTVYKSELPFLAACDVRISGFGVLFGGILILSIIICFICLLRLIIKKSKYAVLLGAPLIITTCLMAFISESWWARYTPYLYLFPIIALVLLLFENKYFKYILFSILSILIILNLCYFIKYNTVVNYNNSKKILNDINDLSKNKKVIIVDEKDEFVGMMYNFEDKNIDFIVSTEKSDKDKILYKWIKYRYKDSD